MGKSFVFAVLTLTIALGLIGLLAYTSESVHHTASPAPAITEVARPRITPLPVEREIGPTLHGTGLMLTH
ncbi:MAG: hypothetical protein WEG40_18325 [Candidatus Rokuibacteriota bacterium]